MINRGNVEKIKRGTWLINTARGGLVETDALVYGLEKGILAGIGLDFPRKDLEEGGLPGAVRPDEAVSIAVAEPDRDVFKQGLAPELHGDVGGAEHEKYPIGI